MYLQLDTKKPLLKEAFLLISNSYLDELVILERRW